MSSPYGQGIQYLQSLQGMVSMPIISVAVSCRNAKSSSVSGFKGEYVHRLSCKCSMRVMPLSTVWTPGRLPAKRNAHEATLLSGSRCLRRAKMVLGTLERRPPNSGSITTAGMFRFTNSLYRYSASVFLGLICLAYFQSR